jgi:Zn-dependent metalloprotease
MGLVLTCTNSFRCMSKSVSCISALFFSIVSTIGSAQAPGKHYSGVEADQICKGATVVIISPDSKVPSLIQLGEQTDYRTTTYLDILTPVLKIRNEDELKEYGAKKDNIGFAHHYFRQYYKGIPVQDGEYVLHEKAGRIIKFNGLFFSGLDLTVNPVVLPAAAVAIALQQVPAKTYAWEDAREEGALRKRMKDSSATYSPKPELIIASKKLAHKEGEFRLCYKVDIKSLLPTAHVIVYVDALTGDIIALENMEGTKAVNTKTPQTDTSHKKN